MLPGFLVIKMNDNRSDGRNRPQYYNIWEFQHPTFTNGQINLTVNKKAPNLSYTVDLIHIYRTFYLTAAE